MSELGLTQGTNYTLQLYRSNSSNSSSQMAGSDEIIFEGVSMREGFVVFRLFETGTNQQPIFSKFQFTIDENLMPVSNLGVFDDNNSGYTYSIGGTDASLFNITNSGDLSFRNAPDYEYAGDDDGDKCV